MDITIITTGIGENSSTLRILICNGMRYLRLYLYAKINASKSYKMRAIPKNSSQVNLLVIPTNEESESTKQKFYLLN